MKDDFGQIGIVETEHKVSPLDLFIHDEDKSYENILAESQLQYELHMCKIQARTGDNETCFCFHEIVNRGLINFPLKYPILASRLIAAQILTETEHGNIKALSADSVDRMDELMGFMHRCDSKSAFEAFVAGVRDCNSNILADKLESDYCGATRETNDEDFAGITVSTSIFETPNLTSEMINEIGSQSSYQSISSTSPNVEEERPASPEIISQAPEGSPFSSSSYRRTPEIRTQMTFQQVLTRQRYGRVDFYFSNSRVSVESIQSNPNAGATYMGCLEEVGTDTIRICARRVTEIYDDMSMGIAYFCDLGHRRNGFTPIPRLKVTFKDYSGVFNITLFRENVEVFLEMSASDLTRLDPSELISRFEYAKSKEWHLEEVLCEKRKNIRFPWDNYVHSISQLQNSTTGDDRNTSINLAKRARIV